MNPERPQEEPDFSDEIPEPDNPILQTALDLLEEGFSVLPVNRSKQKVVDKTPVAELLPLGPDGKPTWKPYQEQAADEATVRRWFADGTHNLAVVCGRVSGNLACLDFDCREAWESFGQKYRGLLDGCPVEETGRGWHLFLRTEEPLPCSPASKHEGFDVKGEGGYVIIAPSIHASGKAYRLAQGDMAKLPVLDVSALGLQDSAGPERPREGWEQEILCGAPEGRRNDAMTRLAGRCLGKGLSEGEVLATLRGVNLSNRPPLGDEELEQIVASVAATHLRNHLTEDPWPTRGPLPELPSVPSLPPEMLPAPLRAWCTDIAARACIPSSW